MAEALMAYAQPLLDQTDGSREQMQHAFTMSSVCYNLALIPEDVRESAIDEMKVRLKMGDAEFEDFRRSVITPMIERHQTMFASTKRVGSTDTTNSGSWRRSRQTSETTADENPATDRYAPCSCESGKKYKFRCGKK